MKYKIDVTEKDIKEGKPLACYQCPVALAMERVIGKKVSVGSRFWGEHAVYDLPEPARKFIYNFDLGYEVEPFSFEVEVGLA